MKPHEYQAFVHYWKSNRETQQAIVDKEKQAMLERQAQKQHMLVHNGKLIKPEDYPCDCELQDPEQCFEETYSTYSVDGVQAKQCFCPCHTYFEPF